MSTGDFLNVDPVEMKFPCEFALSIVLLCLIVFCFDDFSFSLGWLVELKKQISCSLQVSNKTESHVAFKVKFSLDLNLWRN